MKQGLINEQQKWALEMCTEYVWYRHTFGTEILFVDIFRHERATRCLCVDDSFLFPMNQACNSRLWNCWLAGQECESEGCWVIDPWRPRPPQAEIYGKRTPNSFTANAISFYRVFLRNRFKQNVLLIDHEISSDWKGCVDVFQ